MRQRRALLSLEGCVLSGLGLIATSLAALAMVGYWWGRGGFVALPSILPVTLAGLIGAIGIQTLLSGFLLAVLGGNEADFVRDQDTAA
jgi:hypothetical protein